MRRRDCLRALSALAAAAAMPGRAARAGAFPERPVRMIVAFPAGGGTDIVARLVAEQLGRHWGRQVIVDNRGGAGGVIGTEAAARAEADGYTVFMATLGNLSVNPHLYPMNVDPLRRLAPVSKVVDVNFVLVAHPSLAARNVQELVALARSQPDRINYSSSGVGGAPHLAGELFNKMAGVRLAHIPYKGSGPSFTDLVGGQVSLTFDSLVQALPYIRDGRLRPLAVLGRRRSPLLPDVPTVAESGVPGYEMTNWFGLVAPAGTPAGRIALLHDAVARVLADEGLRARLAEMGADAAPTEPDAFGAEIRDDSAKWGRIIREQGIRAQ